MEREEIRKSLSDCKTMDRHIIANNGRRYWVFGHTEDCILAERVENGIRKPLCQVQYESIESVESVESVESNTMQTAKRPGGPLRERTPITLVNGKQAFTYTLFAEIVNNLRNTTIHAFDADGNEYECFHLTIDVNRNLVANSWFQI